MRNRPQEGTWHDPATIIDVELDDDLHNVLNRFETVLGVHQAAVGCFEHRSH